MLDLSLWAIFIIGFLSGSHCVSMCGGFSTALALQLPPNTRRWQLLLSLNLGRLSSYVLIGGLLGALGQYGLVLTDARLLQIILAILSNFLLISFAFYLASWGAWITHLERLGKPIWKHLNPLLNHLLPLRSWSSGFLVGALWGWLPCGLVYSMSLYALSHAQTLQSAWIMLAFGLGTLPNLLAIAWFANTLKPLLQKIWLRRILACLIIAHTLWQLNGLLSSII